MPSLKPISSAPTSTQLSVPQNLSCGALARTVQILSMYPIDTIKVRIQVSRLKTSPLSSLSSALRQGTLYNGAGFSLLGQIPYGMLTFGLYETLRTSLKSKFPDSPTWLQIVIAASVGDAIGSLWLTPSEVIKSKTQAGLFASPLAAVRATASGGGMGGFYQGYLAAVARDVPFRALQLTLYERLRKWYGEWAGRAKKGDLSMAENLMVGAVAGTVTAAVTTPLDVVRTRMMSQASGGGSVYGSVVDCVVKTVGKEGVGALFKGIAPRCFLIGPSSAIFFLAYEMSKTFFRRRQARDKVTFLRRGLENGTKLTCSRRRGVSVKGGWGGGGRGGRLVA